MATLTSASLSERERRALGRLVELLDAEYGDDLHAVWLYGSRARGDAWEDSDIDLMVISSGGHRDEERIRELVREVAEPGESHVGRFSLIVGDPGWLAERRASEAFLLREVDRDKIVLRGGEVEAPEAFTWHEADGPVRQRTREYLDLAGWSLEDARLVARSGSGRGAISPAYYAALNAARALLSEDDVFVRGHGGMWNELRERYVATGQIDQELYARAAGLQEPREQADYGSRTPTEPFPHFTREDGKRAVETAEELLREVEQLLGV
jgi:predicted nucleotidyltransferase/uncharacterized protein (UPF0332 family)